jgi:glucoamylase
MVCKAVAFLVNYEPYTLEDRWERYSGYSPSALTAMIVALICASDFAKDRGNNVLADFLLGCADFLESHIEEWTTTTQGDIHPEISRHYILILPMGQGNKKSQEDPNTAELALFNQKPGNPSTIPARKIVSCDFLELVRYGIRDPQSSLIEDSLKVIDSILRVDTPSGPCWHRYNYDGYGEKPDGNPYTNWGVGRAWPLLTGERGHYELAAKHDPRPFLLSMEAFSTPHGLLSEQIWDTQDIPEKHL